MQDLAAPGLYLNKVQACLSLDLTGFSLWIVSYGVFIAMKPLGFCDAFCHWMMVCHPCCVFGVREEYGWSMVFN